MCQAESRQRLAGWSSVPDERDLLADCEGAGSGIDDVADQTQPATGRESISARLYGRTEAVAGCMLTSKQHCRGTRLIGSVPYGHWNTTTFLAGLRLDGIVAPFVLDGPINAEAFLAWTEQFLVPELRPGDLVIADRLGSYKGVAAREAIEACGAKLLLLPSYSHDLSPIEQVCAKLKELLHKAAPRTREALWRTIGEKLSISSPVECLNYLRNCGYGHPAGNRSSAPIPGAPFSIRITFDTATLPYLQVWRNPAPATAILAIEPCTSHRLDDGGSGPELMLEPGAERDFSLDLAFEMNDSLIGK